MSAARPPDRAATRRRRSPWRLDRRGASSLEFAIVAIPLFLLILSGLELARYAATIASLRAVVGEAVRSATLTGYANLNANAAACTSLGAGTSMIPNSVNTYLVNRNNLTLTIGSCTTSGAVTTVTMTATYRHTFLFRMLSSYTGNFTETATAAFN